MKKGMRNIVLSASAALVVTVGVYHVALLMGAREPATFALAAALAAAFAAALAAAFVDVAAAFAFGLAATSTLAAAFTLAPVPAVFAVAFFIATVAVAAAFAIVAVAVVNEDGTRFQWVVPVYVLVVLAAWGALTIGNVGWSVAIVLCGVAALFTLWRAHSRFAAPDAPPATVAVSERKGA